jgi:hypothetical protein
LARGHEPVGIGARDGVFELVPARPIGFALDRDPGAVADHADPNGQRLSDREIGLADGFAPMRFRPPVLGPHEEFPFDLLRHGESIPAFCDAYFKRRLAADLLGQPRFSWGSANLVAIAETRRAYVVALQAADRGDIAPLMAFARS